MLMGRLLGNLKRSEEVSPRSHRGTEAFLDFVCLAPVKHHKAKANIHKRPIRFSMAYDVELASVPPVPPW